MVGAAIAFEGRATGESKRNMLIFLNSEANYRDGKNFVLVIGKEAAEKFKKAKIDDPRTYFNGKTVRVTGTVTLYREKPQIKVEDPDQIKVVDK